MLSWQQIQEKDLAFRNVLDAAVCALNDPMRVAPLRSTNTPRTMTRSFVESPLRLRARLFRSMLTSNCSSIQSVPTFFGLSGMLWKFTQPDNCRPTRWRVAAKKFERPRVVDCNRCLIWVITVASTLTQVNNKNVDLALVDSWGKCRQNKAARNGVLRLSKLQSRHKRVSGRVSVSRQSLDR